MRRTATALACAGALLVPGVRPAAALTHAPALARVYDRILAARFDDAEREIQAACPPAPLEACLGLRAVSLWWQILMDPENRRLDPAIEAASAAAIEAARAWTVREPRRAEAWFYLAAAHAPLVQWHALRDAPVTAARTGSRTRSAFERALELDPTLYDAHFGIGAYRYYADIAPAAFRVLRWLLLLPGGNRREGLQQMLTARDRGQLVRGEADFQLHWIYLWYEHDSQRALDLLRGLDAQYPSNPLFLKRIAEIERGYFQDHPASAASWQRLIDRIRAGQVAVAPIAETYARLGLAAEYDAMFETDRAVEELLAVLRVPPAGPHGARARAHLQLARAYDRLGERALAVAEYRAAERHAPADEPGRTIRERAQEGARLTPLATIGDAYRLSLEGLRALERGDNHDAVRRLARSVELNPVDPMARCRYARALDASGDHAGAAAILAPLAARPNMPAVVRSQVLVAYAALLERSGDRTQALDLYRRARDVAGGTPRARDDARAAIARLAP